MATDENNPTKKSDFIIRDVQSFHEKFQFITEVKIRLMEKFGCLLPETLNRIFFWKAVNQVLTDVSKRFGKHE